MSGFGSFKNVEDQIVELGVCAILVGGFELYSIQIIINATGLTGVVPTIFATVLVILIVVAAGYHCIQINRCTVQVRM